MTFWYTFSYENKRYQASTGTDNRRLAERVYSKAHLDIVEGRHFIQEKAKSTTFKDMAEHYLTKYQKVRDITSLKRLLPFFGDMSISAISSETVENYILERSAAGAKPATIYNEYTLGRRMFNVARKKWKWTRDNPFADVQFTELLKMDNERYVWLNVKDEATLLEHSIDWLKDIITFAIHTGCRRGEILAMNWRTNINMHQRLVTIKASKGGRNKVIPMSDTLYEMMRQRAKVQEIKGTVFPVKVTAMKDAFERAVKKAGLDGLRFHDLRHTFATRLVQAGVDILAVQKMMGHSTLKMTARYAHHYPESLRPTVRALDICYKSATVEPCMLEPALRRQGKV